MAGFLSCLISNMEAAKFIILNAAPRSHGVIWGTEVIAMLGRDVSVPVRILFLYWGRRGLSRFALDLAHAALANERLDAAISVSRQNESLPAFAELGDRLLLVDTFETNAGALTNAWRIPQLQRQLIDYVTSHRVEMVIELMPHAWSSFVMPVVKARGVRYAVVVHDADTHPGDYRSSSIKLLVERSITQADVILTLSETVAGRLAAAGVPRTKIARLFHPDLDFGGIATRQLPNKGDPVRLAFFGRIMPYKGLALFLDTVELLRNEGIAIEVGVFGEGALGPNVARLAILGAEVVNRWLTEAEIGAMLKRYHAVVLSHIEASQSGVAATAFGAELPVVATPVGGLVDQVKDGVNGLLAARVDADSMADAVKRMIGNSQLYSGMCNYLKETKAERSMSRFVEDCVTLARSERPVVVDTQPLGEAGESSSSSA